MKPWNDVFLSLPLPGSTLRLLLFLVFGLHLLFVLLMLGTAMLGFFAFLRARAADAGIPCGGRVMASHNALKSLAVVLGVAPLLIIQVYNSKAFFTATGLFSYAWLAIIPLLIIGFLCLEVFGHKMAPRPLLALVMGVLGLAALLTVPAVFTGMAGLMERPDLWAAAGAGGPAGAGPDFLTHWIFRFLHILGAAAVFGGAFHLAFSAGKDPARRPLLRRWTFAAVLFQMVVGAALLGTLRGPVGAAPGVALILGAAVAAAVLWLLRAPDAGDEAPADGVTRGLLVLLPVLLVSMLGARQFLQDETLEPERAAALAERVNRARALAPYSAPALAAFAAKLNTVYDNGGTIYDGSCRPCHGEGGQGDGPAARRLLIPAEDLSSLRTDRAYAYETLVRGVPGSAMPYFTVFDRRKLESLLDELDRRFGMLEKPAALSAAVSPAVRRVWAGTCAECHARNGGVSAFGRTLKPEPPDLTRYALTPERTLEIVTDGYPGTVMQPYRDLPEDVRRNLAALCISLRTR